MREFKSTKSCTDHFYRVCTRSTYNNFHNSRTDENSEKLAEIHAICSAKEGHHDVMSNNAYKPHIQEEDT